MNIDEFDALKAGDKITNGNGDTATVIEKLPHVANVRWGDATQGPTFHLFRQGTTWFGLETVAGATEDDAGAVEGH